MKYSYGNRSIKSYYRFRIEQDPETEEYTLVKILRKGHRSFFDEIYSSGRVYKYSVTPPPAGSKKIPHVVIGFTINSDTEEIKKVLSGMNGQASIARKPGGKRDHFLYRIVGNDYIEVILCDENIKMKFWDRLKDGTLDAEINKLIASK